MKRHILAIMFTLAIAAAPALAGVITVDFASMGIASQDLILGGVGVPFTLSGLTFSYDPQTPEIGDPPVPGPLTMSASLDAGGISGFNFDGGLIPLTGALIITFPDPVVGLRFHYTNGLVQTNDVQPFAESFFLPSFAAPTDDTGSFSYSSPESFSQVTLRFGTDATQFTVDSMEYDYVPEPASLLLLGTGLLGLGCVKRWRRSA